MNRIKELRNEKNISQSELAKKFNITQQAVSLYEKGTRDPDTDTLQKLADYFDVSIDYLLGRSDVRKIETKSYNFNDLSGLPEEAIEQVENFIDYLKQKYNSNDTLNKK